MNKSKEDFVKELIKNKGYSNLKKFSEKTEIPYTTLVTILNNSINRASVDNVIKIAKGLDTSVEGLEKMYEASLNTESQDIVRENVIPYIYQNNFNTIQIPFYGDIAAGALATVNAVLENEVTFIPIPEMFLGLSRYGSEELIAFRVNGDSMNKIIPHGSTVVAKKIDTENVKDDDVVIFSHDGQYSMKRFRRDVQDRVLIFSPESTNKKFRDAVVPYITENDLKIYAKVIWYGVSL